MNVPTFTAEASLCRTGRYYQTGRGLRATSSSAQMINAVWPALEQEGEVINIHGCAPGWTDYGGECFPNPGTEPPTGGGGDDWPTDGGPTDGGYAGGSGGRPKKSRPCESSDFESGDDYGSAAFSCSAWAKGGYLWCVAQRGGGSKKYCCRKLPKGSYQCVPHTRVPKIQFLE